MKQSHHNNGLHQGWELLYQKKQYPEKYDKNSEPNPQVVQWCKTLQPNSSVLDLGCGLGRHVAYLGNLGFRVTGIDISPTGIHQARKTHPMLNTNSTFCIAHMASLPFVTGSFDAVLSTSVVSHNQSAGIKQTLSDVYRILNPGGSLLVDFAHKNTYGYHRIISQLKSGEVTEIEPDTFIDLSDGANLLSKGDAFLPHHYPDENEVRMFLSDFDSVKIWAEFSDSKVDEYSLSGYWYAIAAKTT